MVRTLWALLATAKRTPLREPVAYGAQRGVPNDCEAEGTGLGTGLRVHVPLGCRLAACGAGLDEAGEAFDCQGQYHDAADRHGL